ncbi:MFS transporter [Streptomyces abyssalis]|uniref:MFS transporter n=1 Tax=Streptomyces abyssalis TaxID=933944 RepID=A0A1E7JK52_9ACTN|nr:MFS transporter [Streptomyces abyssalis]OEU88027.1 MFS transporter [Streptomyces abyssalis]OEU90889.1 MFS transporter [Streptomyces abyssalis]OEV03830.1 MFS transporter [Streptomyces nanshensis]
MKAAPGDPSSAESPAEPRTDDAPAEGRGWRSWHTLWVLLLLGWTVSAADRAVTGPVVTWMIDNGVGFLADAENPHALGGLVGGLFFAGYMLTQFPGGYLGDRYGHRTLIVVSLMWAGVATMLTGFIGGLVAFIVVRVVTGLGEGAFYSNDRSLITATTPERQRGFGMGVVITGLALGITIAIVFTPGLVELGKAFLAHIEAWRMVFWVLGAATIVVGAGVAFWFRAHLTISGLSRATLHLSAYSAVSLALIMGVYWLGTSAGLSELWIALLEVALAIGLVLFVLARKGREVGPVIKNRDLFLVHLVYIAILWNLWFFSFWSVSIVAGAADSSFMSAALTAAFNAGAGILGFPAGGWISDHGLKRGWGRKQMMLTFTGAQAVLTIAFAWYLSAAAKPSLWVMGLLLFFASLFFNALQPVGHALTAEIAPERLRGSAFGMQNLIGETGAVLSPAISGVLRDSTGGWEAAVWLDTALVVAGFFVLMQVRHRSPAAATA